jgi:DNA polymerase III subunit alpha
LSDFVHLHVHSDFSVLNGLCHISKLTAKAAEYKMGALALTDIANMFASREFYKSCLKENIKPIIGMSCYVAEDMHLHKPQNGVRVGRRLLLLAKDFSGFQTLCRISSEAYIDGFYFKPRIDRKCLEKNHEGLIILSGGHSSELNEFVSSNREDKARAAIEFYSSLVGKENYFIEIQRTGIEELEEANTQLLALAKEYDVKCVATNDVYYIDKEGSKSQDVLMCVGQQRLLNDASRFRYSSDEFYLKSADEMKELYADIPECVSNSVLVADMCNLEFPKREYHLPIFETPDNMDITTFFDIECIRGLKMRYGEELSKEVLDRYDEEKGVILRTGFPTYFLIVADFIRYAREQGIPVGPGRGSAAGSIIAYALEITDIDPMRFNLLFERFLNEERISMPDIDIDFCQERRKDVIKYVIEKYGRDNVSMIATFGTMKAKGVLRDVGRVLNVELKDVDKLCKLIPDVLDIDLKTAYKTSPEMREVIEGDEQFKNLFSMALTLEGTVRSIGTHAAGVVISDKDLKEYLPLYQADDQVSTQYTMTSVEEDCGLLKMDFLGLQNLTVIKKAVDLIKENRDIVIDVRRLPLDDLKVYELLQRGETIGVFQFESGGMQQLLKRAIPERFEDIVALLALYRPGPLGNGMDKVFVDCKNGVKEIEYPHPLCESELSETYGVILYQEQVMRLTNKLASFNLKEADNLRKAMGKKIKEVMMKFESNFVEGSVKNGVPRETAVEIFSQMLEFAKYGFNKSHSVAYAYVSYQTAYLKAHYPQEFMAALMTCDIRNKDKIATFREECRTMKVEVLPPHVNISNFDFRVDTGRIRYGLGGAKGVGAPAVEAIVEEREKKGDFKSYDDFIERVDLRRCGKTAIESLIMCGAMDDLGANRCQMFQGVESSMKMAQSESKKTEGGQMVLFKVEVEDDVQKNTTLPDLPEWPERDKLAHEKEVLGFYISSHPLASVGKTLRFYSSHNLLQLADLEEGSEVCIGGIITECSSRMYKEDKKMFNFQFEDLSQSLSCVYFVPDVNDKYSEFLGDDKIVFLVGRTGRDRNDEPSLRIKRIVSLEKVEMMLSSSLAIHIDYEHLEENKIKDVKKILNRYKGSVPVYFLVKKDAEEILLKSSTEFNVTLEKSLFEELKEEFGPEAIEIRRYNKSLLGGKRF